MIKANKLIINKKISDHWKEKIIPVYSLKMMQGSISLLIVFSIIIFLFYLIGIIFSSFFEFVISLKGIVTSLLFGFCYLYLKNILRNE